MTPTPPNMPQPSAAFAYAQQHADSIRRLISSRLGRRIHRVFDTADIEQSLLKSLLHCPDPQPLSADALGRLVTTIVLHKICDKARMPGIQLENPLPNELDRSGRGADPAEEASVRELIEAARAVVGEDWSLVEARVQGEHYVDLADRFKTTPDALRMRYQRALCRITKALGGVANE